MVTHVAEAKLLDVLEGRGGSDVAHVEGCPRCRERLEEARAGLSLARAAQMPEPSPLYWESMRRQVRRRLEVETPRDRAPWRRILLAPALAAAVVVAGIGAFLAVTSRHAPSPPEAPLPAWSALPATEDDPGLDVLRAVAPAVADVAPTASCAGVSECMVELSDDESQALADRLRREMGEGKSL